MIFQYYPNNDMLYIQLNKGVSIESEEVADGVVLDFDEHQTVIGIEIEDASRRIDLSKLEVTSLPLNSFIFNKAVAESIV
ncbi:MAG: DUF2283 domain-containing protein [Desulfamplus sp.]|nr:DUF2283 domain-containing protein [Desulfamplus sp.]